MLLIDWLNQLEEAEPAMRPKDDGWFTIKLEPLLFDFVKLPQDCWNKLVLSNNFSFDLEKIPPPFLRFLDLEDGPGLFTFKLMSDFEPFNLLSDYLLTA